MVLITEELGECAKIQKNGVPRGMGQGDIKYKIHREAMDTPAMSVTTVHNECEDYEGSEDYDDDEIEGDGARNYWEDEDDIYQEFEELDFEALPDRSDTRSIASDDSFYPYDSSVASQFFRSLSPDSPEPISFFKACSNNNTIIVKIMIRQGVTKEEVKETDRNRRVRRSRFSTL